MSVVMTRGEKRRHAARKAPRGTLFALVSHTVRMLSRGVLIWGAAIGLYSAALVASFTTLEGSAEQLNQLMQAYPKGLMEAFGINDLADPANYMQSQVFGFVPLALAFFPIMVLAGAIAGAEERGTIDVLLGNTLPRWQLVVGNFLAAALSLLAICAVVGLLTWGTAALVDVELSVRQVAEAVLNMWPICLLSGALALLCSALFHRTGLRRPRRPAARFRLLLLRFGHRERHRLGGLWWHNPRGARARAPGGVRLQAAGHIYIASQHAPASPPLVSTALRAFQRVSGLRPSLSGFSFSSNGVAHSHE